MIQQTSLIAYVEVLENLGERQKQVLKCLHELEEANNLMLSIKLNIPINCVTPRINELKRKGIIKVSKIDLCPYTKRKTLYYKEVRRI